MERIEYNKKARLGFVGAWIEDYTLLGTMNGYEVCYCPADNDCIDVDVMDPEVTSKRGYKKRVALLQLVKSDVAKGAWEVELVQVDDDYKGRNLAPRLYAYLIRKLGITIQAGSCQSPGGRAVWARLASRKGVIVYGRTRTGKPVMMRENENRELVPLAGRTDSYDGSREFYMFAQRAA